MRRLVAIGFDHMHMGDQLRFASRLPDVRIVGALDTDVERAIRVLADVGLAGVPVRPSTQASAALDSWQPDLAVVCSTTAAHADWVALLTQRDIAVLLEKPFATSVAEADAMIAAAEKHHVPVAVNWPLAWVAAHRTTQRLVAEGRIGRVLEVHYYGGNRGPLRHAHDKLEVDPAETDPATAWWYRRESGGGSLRDYLGYGTTLGTWMRAGERPTSVTAMTHVPDGYEVDEQSVVVAAYETGLSTFHTRWGTFTDPWTHQTQPHCGFVVIGSEGTISSPDYAEHVVVQTAATPGGERVPVDVPAPHLSDGVAALVHHLDTGEPLDGPLTTAISRTGQAMVDAALRSAAEGRRVDLTGGAA